jgi:ABC-2 type transport system permease protein
VSVSSTGRLLPMGLAATAGYEFKMAVRRRVLWLAMLPLLVLAVLVAVTSSRITELDAAQAKVGTWAVVVNIFAAIGLGVVLADRFVRTHSMGLTELLASTPTPISTRMLGVLVGSLTAGLAPVLATIVVVVPLMLAKQPGSIPIGLLWAIVAVLTVIVPAALIATVFAATAALIMPAALARVLTVLVWFWATIFSPSIVPLPTPTGTLLSPLGDYVSVGWMHGATVWAGRGTPEALSPEPTAGTAVLSLVLILLLATGLFAIARAVAGRRMSTHQ